MDKRLHMALAASLLLVAALPGAASAAGPKDLVAGSATFDVVGGSHAWVSARSDADGDDPRGTYRIVEAGLRLRADVTCLWVEGSSATVGAEITRSNEPSIPVGAGLLHYIEDGGSPGSKDASITILPLAVPVDCETPLTDFPGAALAPVVHGNWVVRDAD